MRGHRDFPAAGRSETGQEFFPARRIAIALSAWLAHSCRYASIIHSESSKASQNPADDRLVFAPPFRADSSLDGLPLHLHRAPGRSLVDGHRALCPMAGWGLIFGNHPDSGE